MFVVAIKLTALFFINVISYLPQRTWKK